jgi:hypothetical protein
MHDRRIPNPSALLPSPRLRQCGRDSSSGFLVCGSRSAGDGEPWWTASRRELAALDVRSSAAGEGGRVLGARGARRGKRAGQEVGDLVARDAAARVEQLGVAEAGDGEQATTRE